MEDLRQRRPAPVAGEQLGFNERNRKDLTADDVRYTTKGNTLYAFVMGWPEREAVIPTLAMGGKNRSGRSAAWNCWAIAAS